MYHLNTPFLQSLFVGLVSLSCFGQAHAETHWAFDDEILWDGDHDLSTTNDQLRVNGSVYMDLFEAQTCTKIMNPSCGGLVGLTNTISVQSALELEIGEVGHIQTIIPLGNVSLGIIPVTPKISLEPRIVWSWDVDALGGWEVETSVEHDFAYTVGLNIGSFGASPVLTSSVDRNDAETSPPHFGDGTELDIRVGLVAQLEVVVRYNGVPTARPYIYAEPYYEIKADPDTDPWWSFWVGYEVRSGVGGPSRLIDFLTPRISKWLSTPVADDRYLLASSDTFATSDVNWEGVRWSQGYDFDAIETARRVIPTLDEDNPAGLVVVGNGTTDGFLFEVDSTGVPIDGVRYDKTGLRDIAHASSNTYIACGDALGGGIWVGELDLEGTPIWTTDVDTETVPECDRILPHPDGGYILSGSVTRGSDHNTPLLMHIDDDGEVVWVKSYDSPATDDDGFLLKDMDVASNGQIVLVGRHGSDRSDFTPVDNAFVLKVDKEGEPVWQRTFGGNQDGDSLADHSVAEAVEILSGGDIVITGRWEDGSRPNGMWMARLNNKGSLKWSKLIGSKDRGVHSQSERGLTLTETPSGLLVGARSGSANSSDQDAWLMRVKLDGTPRWLKVFDGTGSTDIISVYGDDDRVVSLGTSVGLVGTRGDFWLSSGAVDGMEEFTRTSGMTATNGLIDLESQPVTMDLSKSTSVALEWTEDSVELETSTELPSATVLTK